MGREHTMNKLLFLALWLWLPIPLDALLKCINCQFEIPGRGCMQHIKPCRLFVGESCYKKSIFYGNTPIYFEKGCLVNCMPVHHPKDPWNVSETVTCCADTSFCNR